MEKRSSQAEPTFFVLPLFMQLRIAQLVDALIGICKARVQFLFKFEPNRAFFLRSFLSKLTSKDLFLTSTLLVIDFAGTKLLDFGKTVFCGFYFLRLQYKADN